MSARRTLGWNAGLCGGPEELLRVSAEFLGKGGCSTAYMAVLHDGSVMPLERLRDTVPVAVVWGSLICDK